MLKKMTILSMIFILACSLFFFISPVAATTFEVSTTQELEDAFANAQDGDTILIAAGTYYPTVELDFGDRSLEVHGAGSSLTIIDGTNVIDKDDFLLGRDNGSETIVDEIIITDLTVQNYEGEEGIEIGGCMEATVTNCVARYVDDGFYYTSEDEGTSIIYTNCTSMYNDNDGFHFWTDISDDASITYHSCIASSNGNEGFYGEPEHDDVSIDYENCTSSDNGNNGFEIEPYYYDGTITFADCSATNNYDDGFDYYPEYSSTTVDVSNCSASFNEYDGFYFDSYDSEDEIRIDSCIAHDNGADGFYLYGDYYADCFLTNSLSYGNEYGIYLDNDGDGIVSASNCSVFGNMYGLGIYNDGDAWWPIEPTDLYVTNIASSGNMFTFELHEDPYDIEEGDFPSVTNCLFNDDQLEASGYEIMSLFGANIIFEDPMFASPYSNDFRPMAVSPLINSGADTSGYAYGSVVEDIRGIARPQQGAYDIGAYEFEDVEPGLNPSGAASFQPLYMASLSNVAALWEDVLAQLPAELSEEQQALLDQAQDLIDGAAQLGNYIAANGALRQAAETLEELLGTL